MASNLTFEDFLNLPLSLTPKDHFEIDQLRRLFNEKIVHSRATGKDGVRIGVFENNLHSNLDIIHRKVLNGTHRFTPFKERLLLKGAESNPRQICIPTVRDRLVLRAVCQILHQTIPQSTGYSPHAVVDRVAARLRSNSEVRAFVRIDVKEFFPSVRHNLMESELTYFGLDEMTKSLCMSAIQTRIGSAEDCPTKGIAQGLSISGALACIYMLRFDARQSKRFGSFFRYVDDILLIANEPDAIRTLTSVRRALGRLGLKIHPLGTSGKTEIASTVEGIDYLGYHITRDEISVRETSFRRMFKNVLKVVTDFRYRGDIERLVFRLNLKISGCLIDGKRRGWMMYFSRTENLRQLSQLDSFVGKQLARVNFPDKQRVRIKRFVKSYHEICFNLDNTNYIPKFDEYSLDQKAQVVSILKGRDIAEVLSYDAEAIERDFRQLMGQEVHDLEHDVGHPS